MTSAANRVEPNSLLPRAAAVFLHLDATKNGTNKDAIYDMGMRRSAPVNNVSRPTGALIFPCGCLISWSCIQTLGSLIPQRFYLAPTQNIKELLQHMRFPCDVLILEAASISVLTIYR